MPSRDKYEPNGHVPKDPADQKQLLRNGDVHPDTKTGPRVGSLGALQQGGRADSVGALHGSKAKDIGGYKPGRTLQKYHGEGREEILVV